MNAEASPRKIYYEKNMPYGCSLMFTHTNGCTCIPHAHTFLIWNEF